MVTSMAFPLRHRVTPRVAFVACSIFVFLLESHAPCASAAPSLSSATSVGGAQESGEGPQQHQHHGNGPIPEDGALRLARTKRQLIGTPSLPLMMDPKRKRPFCNAFTGCGRKRSEGGRLGNRLAPSDASDSNNGGEMPEVDMGDLTADESMATLVELNSEPAVAELSRQILSEAKLWEAIQEARQEIARRRQQQAMLGLQGQRLAPSPVDRHPRGGPEGRGFDAASASGIRKRRDALAPPPIPKGTLPSAGNGALPIV